MCNSETPIKRYKFYHQLTPLRQILFVSDNSHLLNVLSINHDSASGFLTEENCNLPPAHLTSFPSFLYSFSSFHQHRSYKSIYLSLNYKVTKLPFQSLEQAQKSLLITQAINLSVCHITSEYPWRTKKINQEEHHLLDVIFFYSSLLQIKRGMFIND